MKYVIGVDLGTSAVKTLLINEAGSVCGEASEQYPLDQPQPGYCEQDPEDWVRQTELALRKLMNGAGVSAEAIEGISFSGQMHGLVLLNREGKVIRPAILWNDTRTTAQCREIEQMLGGDLLRIAKNRALEGFTLPKLLWVKRHEPALFAEADVFLLPKDYVRYRMTGLIGTDYSDAAGTLLLDVANKRWSERICSAFELDISICPPLLESHSEAGTLLPEYAANAGLTPAVKVFAGAADNACGAIGAGILSTGDTMCSIGTSGVILAYEDTKKADYAGKLHFFNHGKQDAFYAMGVTLAAGYSLEWFRTTFAPTLSFNDLLKPIDSVPAGSGGLLFTPYLVGERTPHADAHIRSSFIGIDGSHRLADFARAVLEGITYSLKESLDILLDSGKKIDSVVSIGGGAKNPIWLQMQADIFGLPIEKQASEQGPAMGAAMLAAVGCGWFGTLEACAQAMLSKAESYVPRAEQMDRYSELYELYTKVYGHTRELNEELASFRSPWR